MKDGSNRRRLAVVPTVGTCDVLLAAHTRTAAKSPRGLADPHIEGSQASLQC
jgi:hypothetical protein